jgi:hypothetical protein
MRRKRCHAPGAVDAGRLEDLLGDPLQAGEEDERDEGRRLPGVRHDERPHRRRGLGEPGDGLSEEAEAHEEVVRHPERVVEDPGPGERHDRGRERPRDEDDGAQRPPPAERAVEEEGERRPERHLEEDGEAREERRVPEGREEPAVAERPRVRREAGPGGDDAVVELGPGEAQEDDAERGDRHDDGQEDEDRSEEEDALAPRPPGERPGAHGASPRTRRVSRAAAASASWGEERPARAAVRCRWRTSEACA